MKKLLKAIGLLLSIILLLIGLFVLYNRERVTAFPSILSSFTAKTMCSCLFVEGNPEPYCRNYARQYLPLKWAQINRSKKRVTAHALGRTNSAQYLSKRQGCRLTELDKGKK